MALWKPFRGKRSDLDSVEKHDGWIYFTTDDGSLFFDYVDADGNLQRKQITAKEAEKILGYDIATILSSSDAEIPTSKAVLDIIDTVKFDLSNTAAVVLAEAQVDASNKSVVVLAEAQKSVTAEKERAEGVEEALGDRIDTLEADYSTHTHNDIYYTKTEIDNLELITVADIDAICGTTIQVATVSEVTF